MSYKEQFYEKVGKFKAEELKSFLKEKVILLTSLKKSMIAGNPRERDIKTIRQVR